MENSSQRALLALAQSPIPEVMVNLAAAMVGTGPALSFEEMSQSQVPSPVALVVATSDQAAAPKRLESLQKPFSHLPKPQMNFLGQGSGKSGHCFSL
jgi:hypothetical protein